MISGSRLRTCVLICPARNVTVDGCSDHFTNTVGAVALLLTRACIFVLPSYNFTVDRSSHRIADRALCSKNILLLRVRNNMVMVMMRMLQRVLVVM